MNAIRHGTPPYSTRNSGWVSGRVTGQDWNDEEEKADEVEGFEESFFPYLKVMREWRETAHFFFASAWQPALSLAAGVLLKN